MLDERGLKSLRSFAACMLIAISAVTVILMLKYIGYNIGLLEGIKIEEIITFCAFSLIGISIGGIFNRPKITEEETLEIIKRKSRWVPIGIIIYSGYVIFTIIVVKNIYFIISSLIMLGIYINVVFISKALYSYALTDRQRQWREAVNGTTYSIQESNLLWRIKIWMRPLERIPFRDRYLSPRSIFMFVACFAIFASNGEKGILHLIFLYFYIRSACAILEYILGLYTSIIGICTGIEEHEESRNHNHGGGITVSVGARRRFYWVVYITDFENKQEVVYRTYQCPFISKGDRVKVVHGVFSKEVVLVNNNKVE